MTIDIEVAHEESRRMEDYLEGLRHVSDETRAAALEAQKAQTAALEERRDDDAGAAALTDAERQAEAAACVGRAEWWAGDNATIVRAEQEAAVDLLGVDSYADVDVEPTLGAEAM